METSEYSVQSTKQELGILKKKYQQKTKKKLSRKIFKMPKKYLIRCYHK